MSVNESGIECKICGSYNCEYVCTDCYNKETHNLMVKNKELEGLLNDSRVDVEELNILAAENACGFKTQMDLIKAQYLAKFTAYRDEEDKLMAMVKAEARQRALKEVGEWVDKLWLAVYHDKKFTPYELMQILENAYKKLQQGELPKE